MEKSCGFKLFFLALDPFNQFIEWSCLVRKGEGNVLSFWNCPKSWWEGRWADGRGLGWEPKAGGALAGEGLGGSNLVDPTSLQAG